MTSARRTTAHNRRLAARWQALATRQAERRAEPATTPTEAPASEPREVSMPEVKVGSVWADNDKRATGRYVRVYQLAPTDADTKTHALVVACDRDGHAPPNARVGRIRLDRMRPTATGYRLIRESRDA